MKGAVIVGASSGVGRALARACAQAGWSLVLVSRDIRDLQATAADIRLRWGVPCFPVPENISGGDWDVTALVQVSAAQLGSVDAVLVPAGAVGETDVGANQEVIAPVLGVNFVGPARLAAAFGAYMAQHGGGRIVLFSSIAAAAPREKNLAYSAAKAALESYAKGLRHSLHTRGVEVLVLALGYVDTAQSFGLRLLFPVARPEAIAHRALAAIDRPAPLGGRHYLPRFWWLVTTVLRLLPWFLYRRLRF